MTAAKCTSCGASIHVNENKDCGVCPYCNSAYITEKAIKNLTNNTTNNNAGTIINNYFTNDNNQVDKAQYIKTAPPRPVINWALAILLFFFYIFPGIIYISTIKGKQNEWDEKYNK